MCDFERNTLCGMTQLTDDEFDWNLVSGPTPTELTGPNSAKSGVYYVYAPGAGPQPDDKALYVIQTKITHNNNRPS
jgi:hypothetical protein